MFTAAARPPWPVFIHEVSSIPLPPSSTLVLPPPLLLRPSPIPTPIVLHFYETSDFERRCARQSLPLLWWLVSTTRRLPYITSSGGPLS